MFTLENHVGRLVELRMAPPITLDELGGFHTTVMRVIGPLPGKIITVTDLSAARVFDQPVTERLTQIIRVESPRVERNAFLVGEGAIFGMQIERIIREAGFPNRRSFRRESELLAWIAPGITQQESERAATFLEEGRPARKLATPA